MRRVFVFAFLGFAPLAAAEQACPIEKAVYAVNGATLRFVKVPKLARQSDLSAQMRSTTTGRVYKYTFAASNGYSTQYLVPFDEKAKTEEEASAHDESLAFFMFDQKLKRVDLPTPGEEAPPYLFIPDLGVTLWYAEFAPGQKAREAIDTEMWTIARCEN